MMKRIAKTLAVLSLLAAAPALAQTATPPAPAPKTDKPKSKTPQTHHCYKGGELVPDKTRKQCAAAGGEWKKDSAVKAAPKAEGTAPAPVPAPAK